MGLSLPSSWSQPKWSLLSKKRFSFCITILGRPWCPKNSWSVEKGASWGSISWVPSATTSKTWIPSSTRFFRWTPWGSPKMMKTQWLPGGAYKEAQGPCCMDSTGKVTWKRWHFPGLRRMARPCMGQSKREGDLKWKGGWGAGEKGGRRGVVQTLKDHK